MSWLKRLIRALLDAGVPPERRNDVAAAVMTLFGASQSPALARHGKASFVSTWI
jgi:hypothetical protein